MSPTEKKKSKKSSGPSPNKPDPSQSANDDQEVLDLGDLDIENSHALDDDENWIEGLILEHKREVRREEGAQWNTSDTDLTDSTIPDGES